LKEAMRQPFAENRPDSDLGVDVSEASMVEWLQDQ
jgi:hypothetical protein